jgi:hypothetical protein
MLMLNDGYDLSTDFLIIMVLIANRRRARISRVDDLLTAGFVQIEANSGAQYRLIKQQKQEQ